MKKGTLKNIILVLLVISSVVLTFKIWFSEKLWPDGYNFFSNITEKFFPAREYDKISLEHIAKPSAITVTNAPKRSVYTGVSENYEKLRALSEKAYSDTIAKSFESVDEKEWTNALRSRSVHIAYPVAFDPGILAKTLNIKGESGGAGAIKEYVIYSGDTVSSSIYVLIKDYKSGDIYKALAKNVAKQDFEDMLTNYAIDSVGTVPYSFELNFDKKDEDGELQKFIIAPDVQLALTSKMYNDISRQNALAGRNGDYNYESIENILSVFGFNTANAKRYVEDDNSMVYVENYGTVKIYADGFVEYKAVNDDKGIALSDNANLTYDDTIALAVGMVNNMTKSAFGDRETDIRVTSDLTDEKQKTIKLTFDYYVNGVMASSFNDFVPSRDKVEHAVEVVIIGSKVVSYRQMMSYFKVDDIESKNVSSIDALDVLFADKEFDKYKNLTDLFPCYVLGEDGKGKITWGAVMDGMFKIIR